MRTTWLAIAVWIVGCDTSQRQRAIQRDAGRETQQAPPTHPSWGGSMREPGLPVNADDMLAGSASGRAPTITYPLNGALFPPDLPAPSISWSHSQEHDVYRVSILNAGGSWDATGMCATEQCSLEIPRDIWRDARDATLGGYLQITVRDAGPDGAAEASERIQIASDVAGGAIVWFSANDRGLRRSLLDSRESVGYLLPTAPDNQTDCYGCHSMTPDGIRVGHTSGRGLAVGALADSPRRQIGPSVLDAVAPGGITTWSASGRRFAIATTASVTVWRTDDWSRVGRVYQNTSVGRHIMPALDDGARIALVIVPPGTPGAPDMAGSYAGSLATYSVVGGDLVNLQYAWRETASEFAAWPSWSPDGEWIAFEVVRKPQSSYAAVDASVAIVRAVGGQVVRLSRLGIARHPTWAPNLLPGSSWLMITRRAEDWQLWITRVDLDAVLAGIDGSTVPVWLPFQATRNASYLGTWVRDLACSTFAPCPPGTTCAGVCRPGTN